LRNYSGGTLVADFSVNGRDISIDSNINEAPVSPIEDNSFLIDDNVYYWNTVYPSRTFASNPYTVNYYIGDYAISDVSSYFYLKNATLENGSVFILQPHGTFGLQPGQSNAIRLLYAENGQWDINHLVLLLEAESPLLEVSWSELSDQNNLIVKTYFLTPQQVGLSGNASRAVYAALDAEVFTFDSSPEEWVPDVSGAMCMGATAGLGHSFGTMQHRIGGMQGKNSGDDTVMSQGLWYEAGYSDADQKRRSGINGFNAQTTHFSLGYDVGNDSALLGIAYTHSGTDIHGDNTGTKVDSTDHLFSLYSRYDINNFFLQGFATHGNGSIDSYRTVGSQLLEADVDSRLYAISAQVGVETVVSNWQVAPMLSGEYDKQHVGGYQESGGTLALDVNSQDYEIFNIGGGASFKRNWVMEWGNVTPGLTTMLYYDVIGDRMQSVARFVGGQTSFVSNGSDPAQTSWEVSPSVTVGTAGEYPMNFKLSYTYSGKEDFEVSSISGELRFEF